MKHDRFLTGILIGIGVLILLALGLFFLRRGSEKYVAEDSPQGVVHNYVLAIQNKDYKKAYGYLADLDGKPSYENFRQSFFSGSIGNQEAGVDVGDAQITGDEAVVTLTMFYSYNQPFSEGYQNTENALLIRQSNYWKINSMPYSYWDYSWYQSPTKP